MDKKGHAFESPCLLTISSSSLDLTSKLRLRVFFCFPPKVSAAVYLSRTRAPSSLQHVRVSCFCVSHCALFRLSVDFTKSPSSRRICLFPPPPLLDVNRKQTKLKLAHKQRRHRWLTSPGLDVSYHVSLWAQTNSTLTPISNCSITHEQFLRIVCV